MTEDARRVWQMRYRAGRMESEEIKRFLKTTLTEAERDLWQELDAAKAMELEALRTFLALRQPA